MKSFLFLALMLCLARPALALSKEEYVPYTSDTMSVTGTIDLGTFDARGPGLSLKDLAKNYVDTPKGAVDWRLLGATGQKTVRGKDKEGYDFEYEKPAFTPEVKKLEGSEVTIKGFMFPLGAAEAQKEFLFGPFPVGCPFHYHVAPSLVVEVHAEKSPVAFSYDPVTVKGRLELVQEDPENGTFYRLRDAVQVGP